MTKTFWRDLAERVLFTVLYAAVSVAIVSFADLDAVWVLPLMAVLNVVKGFLASKVGDPNTAGFTNTTKE